jgi:hypothetical protein
MTNWIILNLMTNEVNVFASKQEATDCAADVNKKTDGHPSFYLYSNVVGESLCKFEGRLVREFGTDKYEWQVAWKDNV